MDKNKKKGVMAEFKAFIMRGNIVDMAVGVIIGGAFSAIVTALVNKIFMPLINLIVYACTGGNGISLITILNGEAYLLEDDTVNPKCIYIDWGNFIQAVINFLIIAAVLFTLVKFFNYIHEKNEAAKAKLEAKRKAEEPVEEKPAEPAPAPKPTEGEITIALLTEIRDSLKAKDSSEAK